MYSLVSLKPAIPATFYQHDRRQVLHSFEFEILQDIQVAVPKRSGMWAWLRGKAGLEDSSAFIVIEALGLDRIPSGQSIERNERKCTGSVFKLSWGNFY